MQRLESFSVRPLEPLQDASEQGAMADRLPSESTLVSSTLLHGAARTGLDDAARFRIPPLLKGVADAGPSSGTGAKRSPYDPVLDNFVQRDTRNHQDDWHRHLLPPLPVPFWSHRSDEPPRSPSPSCSQSSSASSIWEHDHIEPYSETESVRRPMPYLRSWTGERDAIGKQAWQGAHITDCALLDARSKSRQTHVNISEALLEHLDPVPPPSSTVTYLSAPRHSVWNVLASLQATASTGNASQFFHWDESLQAFDWAHTLQRKAALRVEQLQSRRQKVASVRRTTPERVEGERAKLEWWQGERLEGWTEAASDSVILPFLHVGSLLRRIETRLSEVRGAGDPIKEAPAFAFALETVLNWLKSQLMAWSAGHSVLGWPPATSAILNTASGLEMPLEVLQMLANLLSCAASRRPPFKPLVWLHSTSSCLSHIHSHLVASVASRSSAICQAFLAFLLDRTSQAWRTEVATWIGWPGLGSNRTGEMDHHMVALTTRKAARTSGKWKESKRASPWSGAEIEWALDERGEEDVGYTLRPSAVPSFVGIGDARDFLEAGRALRLLKKAAPEGHPLVVAWTLQASTGDSAGHDRPSAADHGAASASLPVPTWSWHEAESDRLSKATQARIARLRAEIARWRRLRLRSRRITLSASGASTTASGEHDRAVPSTPLLGRIDSTEAPGVRPDALPADGANGGPLRPVLNPPRTKSSEDNMLHQPDHVRFTRMMRLFDAEPSALLASAQFQAVEAEVFDEPAKPAPPFEPQAQDLSTPLTAEEQLLVYLARYLTAADAEAGTEPDAGAEAANRALTTMMLTELTRSSVIRPFQMWSRLINSALISVYFQDLGLVAYLETCKRFLLLGSDSFDRRITAALFGSTEGGDTLYAAADAEIREPVGAIALNEKLTAGGSWPPTDALLSSSLNSAVLETVSLMRQAHSERIELASSASHGQPTSSEDEAISLALKDLDDRLSFAIIDPSQSLATGFQTNKKGWTDPSSIAALDWLTLSFHPPALIAPLLTQLAQMRYQRIWNLLLRFKRVRVAMRGCFLRSFGKSHASSANRSEQGWRGSKAETLIRRFHWTARHFLDVMEGFVHEIGIEGPWTQFMARLERVKHGVSDDRAVSSANTATAAEEDPLVVDIVDDDPSDQDRNGGDGDSDSDNDNDNETRKEANQAERDQLGTAAIELKDVFSLARYHERVLDRMLESCFLKQKQRAIAKILADILQAQLDFCSLASSSSTPRGDPETLDRLFAYHQARVQTFIRALLLVRDRAGRDGSSSDRAATAAGGEGRATNVEAKSQRRQDLESELERQQDEWQRDLEMLESGAKDGQPQALGAGVGAMRGTRVGTRSEVQGARLVPIEVLLARLNASGFYMRDAGGY